MLEMPVFTGNWVFTLPVSMKEEGYSIYDNVPLLYLNSTFTHRNFALEPHQFDKDCTSVNKTFFMCKFSQPIRLTPEDTCVQSLLGDPSRNPTVCKHKFLKTFPEFLTPMSHENTWLFWVHKESILYSQCVDGLYSNKINKAGLIQLVRNCEFRIGEYMLPFIPVARYNLTVHQPQNVSLPSLERYKTILTQDLTNLTTADLAPLDIHGLRKNLQEHSKSIDHFENELNHIESSNFSNLLNVKLDSTIGSVGILTVIGILWIVYKFNKIKVGQTLPMQVSHRPIVITQPISIPRREQILGTQEAYIEPI